MNPLKQVFFKGFKKQLRSATSPIKAERIWAEAGREYENILSSSPEIKKHKGAMVLQQTLCRRVKMDV